MFQVRAMWRGSTSRRSWLRAGASTDDLVRSDELLRETVPRGAMDLALVDEADRHGHLLSGNQENSTTADVVKEREHSLRTHALRATP